MSDRYYLHSYTNTDGETVYDDDVWWKEMDGLFGRIRIMMPEGFKPKKVSNSNPHPTAVAILSKNTCTCCNPPTPLNQEVVNIHLAEIYQARRRR